LKELLSKFYAYNVISNDAFLNPFSNLFQTLKNNDNSIFNLNALLMHNIQNAYLNQLLQHFGRRDERSQIENQTEDQPPWRTILACWQHFVPQSIRSCRYHLPIIVENYALKKMKLLIEFLQYFWQKKCLQFFQVPAPVIFYCHKR
jgi:hypothetical protein